MSTAAKDTIYIDIDDEITSIIEKVQAASHKVVALVLPKRAVVLQSVVNMKLLKRAGDEAKKNIVLITSESNLMPLAGAVGLHVAKTLQTPPAIPPAPDYGSGIVTLDDDTSGEEPALDASRPVGELAGATAVEETIEVDNTDLDASKELKEPLKKPTNKKLRIPNFNKFRTRLFLGGSALILLLVLWYLAAFVMPKATITIKTDTQSVTSDFSFTTKPDAEEVDVANRIIPATVKEVKKTDTEKVAATGQKDVGTRATGTINIKNCEDSSTRSVPAGTTFTAGGKNYVSSEAKTVPAGLFAGGGTVCNSQTVDVSVAAAENGESYNRDAGAYTSSSPALQGNFKLNGSDMTGGTTKLVKIVSQQDVDGANKKIQERIGPSGANELAEQLEDDDLVPLIETLITASPEVTTSPKVGEEGEEVTVTSVITNTMIGVKKDDLLTLIKDNIKDQIDTEKQAIVDDGLGEAIIRATDKKADGNANLSLQTVVVAGAQLDQQAIKQEVAGKKRGETQSILFKRPGVQDVRVDYSPFWVYSTPKKTDKIKIIFEQATANDAERD